MLSFKVWLSRASFRAPYVDRIYELITSLDGLVKDHNIYMSSRHHWYGAYCICTVLRSQPMCAVAGIDIRMRTTFQHRCHKGLSGNQNRTSSCWNSEKIFTCKVYEYRTSMSTYDAIGTIQYDYVITIRYVSLIIYIILNKVTENREGVICYKAHEKSIFEHRVVHIWLLVWGYRPRLVLYFSLWSLWMLYPCSNVLSSRSFHFFNNIILCIKLN